MGAPFTAPRHPQLPLRFATKERDGLLLYNGRFNEKHDFVALEVIQEQVQLTFSAGELVAPCLLALDSSTHMLSSRPGPSAKHEHTLPIPSPHLVSQLTWSFPQGSQPPLCPHLCPEGSVTASGTQYS